MNGSTLLFMPWLCLFLFGLHNAGNKPLGMALKCLNPTTILPTPPQTQFLLFLVNILAKEASQNLSRGSFVESRV